MFTLKVDPRKLSIPSPDNSLPGRSEKMPVPAEHFVTGSRLEPPFPAGTEQVLMGMGCFWGAEQMMWQLPGVYTTAVGYAGGHTPNPTYQEVCSGSTGHNEVVLVVFDPGVIDFSHVLQAFWEGHDPTQGMRQGADTGTQYRSGLYVENDDHQRAAERSRDLYQKELSAAACGEIGTEIVKADAFYYAEEYHQQYLAKNPGGYCGHGGTGVACPVSALSVK